MSDKKIKFEYQYFSPTPTDDPHVNALLQEKAKWPVVYAVAPEGASEEDINQAMEEHLKNFPPPQAGAGA